LNPNSDLGGAVGVTAPRFARREERCVPGGYVSDRLNPNSDLGGAVPCNAASGDAEALECHRIYGEVHLEKINI